MVLNGVVYDVTEYAPKHPGGNVIFDAAGKDGTALFSKLDFVNKFRQISFLGQRSLFAERQRSWSLRFQQQSQSWQAFKKFLDCLIELL